MTSPSSNTDTLRRAEEARRRYASGERPSFSTGICDQLTYGYGSLSTNGYWEFPLHYDELNERDRALVDDIAGRPWEQTLEYAPGL